MTRAEESGNALKSPAQLSNHALEPDKSGLRKVVSFGNAIDNTGVEHRTTASVSSEHKHGHARRDLKRKSKRRNDSFLASVCQLIVQHQIGLAANLLTLLALTHLCFPRARQRTRKFFRLSYHNHDSGKYAIGSDDLYLVAYWIIMFTGIRALAMDYVLFPLGQLLGLEKTKEKTRFAEQAWVLIYDTAFWSLGMYLMYNSEYWLNLRGLWTGWPDRELHGIMKWYYLVQFAFWIQQILVVNIEERRKDHWQMFTHHIITCTLMSASYAYHQTRVGNTILCLMDVIDLLFPIAKILKYLQFQNACNFAFGTFMFAWFCARHVLYLIVCYSVWADIPREITYGCYRGPNSDLQGPLMVPNDFDHFLQPFRNPRGLVCWDNGIKWGFLSTLLALQVILLIWFVMIIRVALKVLQGGEAEDSRSDDEVSESEEDEDFYTYEKDRLRMDRVIESLPLEEEVGVDAVNLATRKTSPTKKFRKSGSAASGVHLPSDTKELLGRIGCDKGA